MAWERLVLLAVVVACVLELERIWRTERPCSAPISILLVADGASHEVEGLVRYLYWEFTVRNRLYAEIAVETGDRSGECAQVAAHLLADGFLVERVSTGPSLVFLIRADTPAAG